MGAGQAGEGGVRNEWDALGGDNPHIKTCASTLGAIVANRRPVVEVMMASVLNAARSLGDISGWTLSNLEMQKTLYFAHMLHLGRGHGPLFDDPFEAWDYGPVVSRLYHVAKAFGAKPIPRIFYDPAFVDGSSQRSALADAYEAMIPLTPGQMIELTHWSAGAWGKHYTPGRRHRTIPNPDIEQEYHDRMALGVSA